MFDAPQTNSNPAPAAVADQSGVSNQADNALQDQLRADADDVASDFIDPDAGDDQQQQSDEETDELDIEGTKLVLPKAAAEKIRASMMMHGDYTQKTQATAAERQQLAAAREQFQAQQVEHQGYIQDIAKVVALDDQLAQFRALDMQKIIAEDPQYAMQLQQAANDLQNKRAMAAQSVAEKQQKFALESQQEIAKQIQDASAYFQREIKGWTKDRSDQLLNYGVAEGMDGRTLSQIVIKHPAIGKLLHKAELYDALLKKQAPKPAPKVPAQPVQQVGSSATVKVDPTKMTDAQFAAARRKQIAKRS